MYWVVWGAGIFFSAFGLTLDGLFMDNMVLQRGKPIPVFGTAEPGAEVTVEFAGQEKKAVADSSKHWNVMLDPMPAFSKPRKLKISSTQNSELETLNCSNVLVGDVWLCGGQSNMDTPVSSYSFLKEGLADVKNPLLRLYNVKMVAATEPQDAVEGEPVFASWLRTDPETVQHFSAVGICFGLRLQQESGVPVGLIESAVGGSQIQPWLPAESLEAMGRSSQVASPDRGVNGRNQPAVFYNGMIHALRRLPMKGVIWYQGESNCGDPSIEYYDRLFEGLIASWRARWNQPELRFYFVQLAPYGMTGWDQSGESWAWLRAAQEKALSLPHTGRVVITDLGEFSNIHPENKEPVGDRLADLALRDLGLLDFSGFPCYKQMRILDDRIQIDFSAVGSGLQTARIAMNKQAGMAPGTDPDAYTIRTDVLAGFAVCGPDHQFVPAIASIVDQDTVEVWSDKIDSPVAVRYGWENFPLCNLANSDGLPASPFRTDNFPMPIFRAPILRGVLASDVPSGAVACESMPKPDEVLLKNETVAGRDALRSCYLKTVLRMNYFFAGKRDGDLRQGKQNAVRIVVDYLDDGPGMIEIKYDSVSKPWKSAGIVELTGTGRWMRVEVTVDDAKFAGRCNGADIRVESNRDFYVSGVYTVVK